MTKIEKKNWVSKFNLLGEVRLNDNTFQIDNVSTNSNWQYSRMNLCVKCGDEVEFICEGEDEEEALQGMIQVIEDGLGE